MRKQINRRLQPPLLVARSSGIAFVNRWAVTTASQIQCRRTYSDDIFYVLSCFIFVRSWCVFFFSYSDDIIFLDVPDRDRPCSDDIINFKIIFFFIFAILFYLRYLVFWIQLLFFLGENEKNKIKQDSEDKTR